MIKPKIFVSYSHKDNQALEQLQPFLKPLKRDGLIEVFIDTDIKSGEDWKKEIIEALDTATAAVLFISQDFLASDFIYREELPHILKREAAHELTMLPVFLDVSDVRNFDKLTRLQGIGTPDRPLLSRDPQERKQLYLELTERIRELAGTVQPSIPPTEPLSRQPTPYPAGSRTYQLTVYLARRGNALDARYYLPGTDIIAAGSHPWQNLPTSQDPSGETLFRLLFGTVEEQWQKVSLALFRQSPPLNPIWAPVRLRICTDDPVLLHLPWCLTKWNDWLLVDRNWEFTTTHVIDPTEDYTTYAPCEVLIVAPQAEVNGIKPDPEHAEAIKEVLQKVWPTGRQPDYMRTVRTRSALENALSGMRPHLLYVYSQLAGSPDRPGLRLDDGMIRFTELADRCKELQTCPAVIYLNTPGPAEIGPSPGRILGEVAPLVIWRRSREWGPEAAFQAVTWLNRWLGQGEDPLTALHAVKKQQDSTQAATLAEHSTYRTWKTYPYSTVPREQYAHLVLDRDEQKAQVGKHLKELVRSDKRRVMALVACAAPGNLLGSLHEQLRHYLELEVADVAEIDWPKLQFPENRQNLRSNLEYELGLQLEADDNEPVKYVLRRHAPRVIGTGKKAMLWLNWGIFGDGADRQMALKPSELETWLRFSSGFLCSECPDDLRIVSYAAIEVKSAKLDRLVQTLQQYGWQDWCIRPAFRLSVLPPLGKVSESHLYDYLVDGNTGCDADIQSEVAKRLIAAKGGDFEHTIDLIREAENGSWRNLLSKLRREQGVTLPTDDEPF